MDWTRSYSPHFRDHLHRYHFWKSKLKSGRGLGWGDGYSPWVHVRQVKSAGKAFTPHIQGMKVNRIHHLLSNGESSYFYMAERWPFVTDIREQWPILDLDRTNELHFRNGIAIIHRDNQPQPATIDFMLTVNTDDGPRCRAIALKSPEDFDRPKTQLYLDVQRQWCRENGIPFAVVVNTYDPILNNTLSEIRKWFDHGYQPDNEKADEFAKRFLAGYKHNVILSRLLEPLATSMKVEPTEAMNLFRYCAWSNRIRLNLLTRVAEHEGVVLVR